MKVPWEMSYDDWNELYVPLVHNADLALARGDMVQYQELTDKLRSLPGYPMHAHPTEDIVVPVPPTRSQILTPRRVT